MKHIVQLSRIVAKTWIPNPNEKPIVDHIYGDTLDDSLENLQVGNLKVKIVITESWAVNNRSTGIKNISLTRYGTYEVHVVIDGKSYSKSVKTIEEAI